MACRIDCLTEIGQAGLGFPPGTQYGYSNSNYYLLGSMIEKLTGLACAAVVEQYILKMPMLCVVRPRNC
jgi:CubicO group peptidase (beta-lactamase class C family)